MSFVTRQAWGACALVTSMMMAAQLQAQPRPQVRPPRPPIIDMHLHARVANHYGATGLPMCAPVERMPRWDQR